MAKRIERKEKSPSLFLSSLHIPRLKNLASRYPCADSPQAGPTEVWSPLRPPLPWCVGVRRLAEVCCAHILAMTLPSLPIRVPNTSESLCLGWHWHLLLQPADKARITLRPLTLWELSLESKKKEQATKLLAQLSWSESSPGHSSPRS